MKNRISILILLFVTAIPQIASASWWNPLTWSKAEIIQTTETPKVEVDRGVSSSTPQIKKKTADKPAIVEKVVTQVIKVDNPELQAKIDALIKQNADLNTQISGYISRLNECREQAVSSVPINQNTLLNSNVSIKIINNEDIRINEVQPNIVSQKQLKSGDKIKLTIYGINFQNSSDQHRGMNKPPLVFLSNQPGRSSSLTSDQMMSINSYDDTSITFTISANAIPTVISDSQGNVYPAFTFRILRQKIANEYLGQGTVDPGAEARFTIPILDQ